LYLTVTVRAVLDTRKPIPNPKAKWILGNRIIISKRLLLDLETKIVESQIFNQIKIKNIKIYNDELGKNKVTGTSLKKF